MGKTLGLPRISNLCPWAVTIVRWAQEKIIYNLDYSLLFEGIASRNWLAIYRMQLLFIEPLTVAWMRDDGVLWGEWNERLSVEMTAVHLEWAKTVPVKDKSTTSTHGHARKSKTVSWILNSTPWNSDFRCWIPVFVSRTWILDFDR